MLNSATIRQASPREQARAFRHATGAEGLAIIDGQAGTGKSYTMAADPRSLRSGRLSRDRPRPRPTRSRRTCSADGFGHAGTVHSELFALNNGRTSWDAKTVVMVDEAAMLDTKLMAMVTAHAQRRRRETDPGRRRPAAFQHRPRRHVRRAERPPRRGRADRGQAPAQGRRPARGRDDGRREFSRRARHL